MKYATTIVRVSHINIVNPGIAFPWTAVGCGVVLTAVEARLFIRLCYFSARVRERIAFTVN